jgi:hypothetical protein
MVKLEGQIVCQVRQTEEVLNMFRMKKKLGKYEITWKDNDTIGLKEIGCGTDSSGSG